MTRLIDPIQRLRDERPDPDTDPRLAAPPAFLATSPSQVEPRARRVVRRRRLQLGIVALAAVAIVLTGAISLRSADDGASRIAPGITVAEAREQAIGAIRSIGRLENYTYSSTNEITELGGEGRTYEMNWTFSRFGRDSQVTRWNRNDFADIPKRPGLEERVVRGYRYESRGSTRAIDEPWLLDVRDGWSSPSSRGGPGLRAWMGAQPDFDALVAQLEREGLIDARREEDGSVIIEIERAAKELAPITASVSGNDPISMFAMGAAQSSPERVVTVRFTIGTDDSVRLETSAEFPTVMADGHGGLEIEARSTQVHAWTPRLEQIDKPAARDVMVVGDAMRARQGISGPRGPLGTLDTLSIDDLRRLRAAAKASKVPPRINTRPTRSYPKLFARRRAEQQAFRRVVADMMPFDRAAFAKDERCDPLWPDSRRAMERSIADAKPEAAGWKCELPEDLGTVVIMPAPQGLMEWHLGSGGMAAWGSRGYEPR